MEMTFLHRTRQCRELLLFFNGWGMDETVVRHLSFDRELAVLELHDYAELPDRAELDRIAGEYKTVHLCAWSLGVRAAAELYRGESGKLRFASASAWNGLPDPVDDDNALPEKVFHQTGENWPDPAAREKFFFRVFGVRGLAPGRRTPESQQNELLQIGKRLKTVGSLSGTALFRRAFAGVRDRIFPFAGQLAAWRLAGIEAEKLDCGHDPFVLFTSWREVAEYGKER